VNRVDIRREWRRRAARVDIHSLKLYIKRYVREHAIGLFEVLNAIAMKRFGKDVVLLLLTEPNRLYEIVLEYYSSREAALFTLSRLFIRPLAIKLGILEREDELIEAAINNPKKFVEILREHGLEVGV